MNMFTEFDALCSAVATSMIMAPRRMAVRRPKPSVTYGEKGYAQRQPMFCNVMRRHVSSRCILGMGTGSTHLDGVQKPELEVEN